MTTTNADSKTGQPLGVALTEGLGLVERLREADADYTVAWGSGDLYGEAADEIERLRAAYENACAQRAAIGAELAAERERCAKLCDAVAGNHRDHSDQFRRGAGRCAADIRA